MVTYGGGNMSKRRKLPAIDLSKYNSQERLPSNVYSIIKNALVYFEGNPTKVSKHYNLDIEKVNIVYEESYLVINQIIESTVKSNELDKGIEDSIELMSDHIKQIKKNKNNQNQVLTDKYINQLTRMTDRFISLKEQNNRTFDILVNRMNDFNIKQRQLEVLESGKVEPMDEYDENVETVFSKLRSTASRKIKATNVVTKEVRHYSSITEAAIDLKCNGDSIRKRLLDKLLHRNEWAFEEE